MSPGAIRRTQLLPAIKRLMARTHESTVVFVPPSTFTTVVRSTLPVPGAITSSLSITMCADQVQAATFCLYSPLAMHGVTARLADNLKGPGIQIRKSQIDIDVVKYWSQEGYGPVRDPDETALVPKFLLKDDRVKVTGPVADVRLTGDPMTDILADTTKQFWVTVHVPGNATPGTYSGRIIISAQGSPVAAVPVSLTVLPLRLTSPAKEYVINLRSRIDDPPGSLPSADGSVLETDFVSREQLDAQLADIAAHGVHSATVRDPEPELWDALSDYKSAGFRPPYVYTGPSDPLQVESDRAAHMAPGFTYFVSPSQDEPARLAALTAKGLDTAGYIAHENDLASLNDGLETVIYSRDSEYPQQLIRTHGQRTSSKHDWWYWEAASDDARTNRYSAGWLLWRTKLYGGFIADYQSTLGTDPFDENSAGAPDPLSAFRPQMLTYPAKDGVIDTVQWEAVREGINDTRYLTTFYSALRECKDNHVVPAEVSEAESYASSFLDKPLSLLSDAEFDAARARIAHYAVILRSAVDAYYAKHPS